MVTIGYPDWWPSKTKRETTNGGGRFIEKKAKPRAAHVNMESSPIPGLTAEQYAKLIKHLTDNDDTSSGTTTPNVNMAGLILKDPDWNG